MANAQGENVLDVAEGVLAFAIAALEPIARNRVLLNHHRTLKLGHILTREAPATDHDIDQIFTVNIQT